MSLTTKLCLCIGAVLLGCLPPPADGQAIFGSITGYVYDSTGGAVEGAKVTATNSQTGVATTRRTDGSGLYLMPDLPPSSYSLAVEAPGFQRFLQENITLRVDMRMNLDVHLSLGNVSEQITVSSAPAMLKTEDADVSTDLSQVSVENLPTLGRNVSRLAFIAPGTVRYRGGDTYQPTENPTLGSTSTTNGRFWGDNDYVLDGVTNVEFGLTGVQIIVPNQDSIQEVKMTTSEYNAENGGVGGLVTHYVTKAGSNEIHGSVFWYNRNKAFFAANPFTEKISGTGKDGKGTGPAPYNWNQQGFSLGGPIRKNKLFFFVDYQPTRNVQGGSVLTTYPVADFQQGNFQRALGAAITANGQAVMVPTTEGGMVPARQNMVFDPTTGSADGSGRSVFSCNGQLNVICPNRLNPVSLNILNLLNQQSSNLAVNQGLLQNNVSGSGSSVFNQDQFDVRSDYNLNDTNKLFVRYTQFRAVQDVAALFGLAGGPGVTGASPVDGTYVNHHGVLSYSHNFSPSLLAEGRLGFARFGLHSFQFDAGHLTNDEVGIKGINSAGDLINSGLANIHVDGPVGPFGLGGTISGAALPRFDVNTVFQYSTNWTKIMGSHAFRWGADIIRQRSDFNSINESSRGDFTFNRLITASGDAPGTGLGMASFLLGLPSNFSRGKLNFVSTERIWRDGIYFQDAWRVTPKLTVNYGLRWDLLSRPTPHHPADIVNYDPNTNNLLLGCVGQVSCTGNVDNDYKNFGPRLSIAYKLFSNTVIRTGYGRSYFATNYGGYLGTMGVNYPTQIRQHLDQTNQYFPFPSSSGGFYSLDQTVPAPPVFDIPSSGLLPLPADLTVYTVPKNNKTSSLDNWNFTVQQQVLRDLSVSVGYVGNSASHLYDNQDINTPIPGPGDDTSRRPYYGVTGRAGPINLRCHCLSSNYNSLLLQVDKRFSDGYTINANYTWSKAIDIPSGGFAAGGQNEDPYNRLVSRGISDYNRASVLTVAHVWELPFGKGRRFGSASPHVVEAVLGGWAFNGVTTLYSGFPVAINWGDASSLNSTFGQRPDLVGDPHVNNPSRNLWYNPAAFANPGLYQFGNYGRNGGDLRGPGLFVMDLSLAKRVTFKTILAERTSLEFRWDTFNSLNRTNLGTPDNAADSPTAGQIFSTDGDMRRMQFGLRLAW